MKVKATLPASAEPAVGLRGDHIGQGGLVEKIVPGGLQRGVDRRAVDAGYMDRDEITRPDARCGLGVELEGVTHLQSLLQVLEKSSVPRYDTV